MNYFLLVLVILTTTACSKKEKVVVTESTSIDETSTATEPGPSKNKMREDLKAIREKRNHAKETLDELAE